MVKLYQVEHAQEVYVVVDSSRLSAREQILESYVDAALHLALVAERQGDRFGLVTFSDRPHRMLRARSGMDHFRLCRETIYNLQARRVSPDFREVFTSLQLNLRRRSLLVFFTSLDDPLLAETFEREVSLLARRHLVLVNVMRTAGLKPLFEGDAPADVESRLSGSGRADALEQNARAADRAAQSRRALVAWSIRKTSRRRPPRRIWRSSGGSCCDPRSAALRLRRASLLGRIAGAARPAAPGTRTGACRLPEIERLHYLYERCSADLVRLDTFATEPQLARVCGIAGLARLCGDPRDARAGWQDSLGRLHRRLSARLPPASGRVPAGRRH